MKFVSLVNGLLGRTRRAVSQPASVQDLDVKDPAKIGEALRQLTVRLNKLEAQAAPEATEFEVDLPGTGALVELPHGFKTRQVRWTVVGWFCRVGSVSPAAQPNLVYDPSSTVTSLFLRSYQQGRAIIRVEPSQTFLDTGSTVDLTDTQLFPRNPFGPQRVKATITGTASTNLLTVPVPDNCNIAGTVTVLGRNITTPAVTYCQVLHFSCNRTGAGVVTLTFTAAHTSVGAGMTYTVTATGNDVIWAVQCTTAAQTVDWTITLAPVAYNLRGEL